MPEDQRSKRVLDLCDQALGLDNIDRDKFLELECGNDSRLRASVDSVLIAVDEADQTFDDGDSLDTDTTDHVGRQIGSYQIKERLGKGGMGSVYLAHRHEDGFDQRVAIKFVHSHMMAKELIERFNAERQILAALNHPYIAALIDGGTSTDGIPYIVMEYVDGVPIDEYCDANKLDLRARIELIGKVAMAVQSAHQSLVVHRDLKPSNVLITPDGIPKLLDFGIAKLIQADGVDGSGNTTVFGRQAMTPDYASPEQILENKVTTASDVYTLGVLTYLLLVGERPYSIQTTSHREMMKSVEGLTVPRPSTRFDTVVSTGLRADIAEQRSTTPGQLRRSLQGDLDNILLMALRQEPDRRYYSVAQFAEDLERYLHGLPVIAREDSVHYRTRKFLQRNWLVTGAATLLVLSLTAGVAGYASQASEARRQRDIAREAASNAENTVDFLREVLFAGDPFATSENEQTVDDVLAYAGEHVDEEYTDDPAARALILTALGDINIARSAFERGEKLATKAVRVYEDGLGANGNNAANAYRVQALAFRYLDEFEQSASTFERAIALYTETADPDWVGLTMAYDQMAIVQDDLSENEAATEYRNLALATYRENDIDDPPLLISMLSNLGVEYLSVADYVQSDKYFREAIDIARQSNTSDGQVGMLLANHAGALTNLGRMDEAVNNYVAAIALLSASAGPEHRETIVAMTSLASLYRQIHKPDEAEATIRQAIAASTKSPDKNRFVTSFVQNVAGSILCENRNTTDGMQYAQASLQTRRELLPPEHWAISSGAAVVGTCLVGAGKFAQAEVMLLKAYNELRDIRGDDHELTITTRARVHDLYVAWGKPREAAKWQTSSD